MTRVLFALLIVSSLPAGNAVGMHMLAKVQAGAKAQAAMLAETELTLHKTPIRRVIDVLERMLKKVEEEDKEDDKLCEEARCHCKTKIEAQRKVVEMYQKDLPELEAEYKELTALIHETKQKLNEANKEVADLKKTLADMVALHEKEYAAELKVIADFKTNIAALTKAITALEKGLKPEDEASFLQSDTANVLRKLVESTKFSILDADRDTISSFLDQGSKDRDESEEPDTNEIIGILKQMKDTMKYDLKEVEDHYLWETREYQKMKAKLELQIQMLEDKINDLTARLGEYMIRLNEVKALINDIIHGGYLKEKALLDEMIKACTAAQHVCETAKRLRREEISALTEAIALLGDDASLDLFNTTLDHMSFLQVGMEQKDLMKRAHSALTAKRQLKRDARFDAISLLMQGKKVDMSKVIKMIDQLITMLKKEATDELLKRDYCISAMGEAHFKKRFLDKKIDPIKEKIKLAQIEVDKWQKEIDELQKDIDALDKILSEDKAQREKEKAQHQMELAADKASLDLLKVAKQRLTSFYNFLQAKIKNYKPQNASQVLTMLDEIIHDLEMHMQANATAEKIAQEDFDKQLKGAIEARQERQEMMLQLRSDKAEADNELQKHLDDYAQYHEEEQNINNLIMTLGKECDWLVKNFQLRIMARDDEIISLKDAKAVLTGATIQDSSEKLEDRIARETGQTS